MEVIWTQSASEDFLSVEVSRFDEFSAGIDGAVVGMGMALGNGRAVSGCILGTSGITGLREICLRLCPLHSHSGLSSLGLGPG